MDKMDVANMLTRTSSMEAVNAFARTSSLESVFSDLSRTNSDKDFISTDTMELPESEPKPEFGNTIAGLRRKRSNLSINTSVGNFFQLIRSPSDQSPTTISSIPSPGSVCAGTALTDMLADMESNQSQSNPPQQSNPQGRIAMTTSFNMEADLNSSIAELSNRLLDASQRAQCTKLDMEEPTSSLLSEPKGPFGPYNPPPSYMLGLNRMRRQELCEPYITPPPPETPDAFSGKIVTMIRGKYKGRTAFVQRRVNKKYRVQVEGVAWGLEFYPDMFALV